MAQRYGGKFSPDENSPEGDKPAIVADTRRVDAAGAKSNILFLPAIPLVFFSLNEGATTLALALVAAVLLTLAAWLLRDGLRAEAAFNARKVARRPAFPRKMAASVLTATGVAVAAITNDGFGFAPLLFGIIAGGLHVASFGIDPLRNKRMEGIDTFQQDRVARVVDQAEAHLKGMKDAIIRAGDRGLEARVDQFQNTARVMARTVEEDPRDLTAARKYLGVYLEGARDATVKFADLFARTKDAAVKADFETFLSDIEANFNARTQKLLLDDRTDMDIEIKVLRDRLQREGVMPKAD